MKKIFESKSLKDTEKIGKKIAQLIKNKHIVLLFGDLGYGKTTLIKSIINSINGKSNVISPTFNILKTFNGKRTINHFDLYRITDKSELANIGFFECIESNDLNIIEWPQIAIDFIPTEHVEIEILKTSENSRQFKYLERE